MRVWACVQNASVGVCAECVICQVWGRDHVINVIKSCESSMHSFACELVQMCVCRPYQWRNYGRAGGAVAPPAFEEPETVTAALSL